jgi:hypothetical protein
MAAVFALELRRDRHERELSRAPRHTPCGGDGVEVGAQPLVVIDAARFG